VAKHAKATTGRAVVRTGSRVGAALSVAAAGLLATYGTAAAGVGGTVLGEEYELIEAAPLPGAVHACDNGATIGDTGVEMPTDDNHGCSEAEDPTDPADLGDDGGPAQS